MLNRSRNADARELVEACHIKGKGSARVSDKSVALCAGEMDFVQEVL